MLSAAAPPLPPAAANPLVVVAPAVAAGPLSARTLAATQPVHTSAAFRRLENMHIIFWLLKDIGWCMVWRPLGLAMIAPTLAIALFITWRTRHVASERAHNLAVVCWITANSYWMVSEFLHFDEVLLLPGITGKHLTMLPFVFGLALLAWYYLVQRPKETDEVQVATL